jgi:hypothetical protein
MRAMNNATCVRWAGVAAIAMAGLLAPAGAAGADGPSVRVTRHGTGRVVMEVADQAVRIRKDVSADRSVLTLTTATDHLILMVRRGVLSLSGPAGEVTMDGGGVAEYGQVLAVLQGSEAAARARTLLAQVAEGPDTFVGQSVLLTRALLESGSGSSKAMAQHQQWAERRVAARAGAKQGHLSGRPQVVRAAFSDLAPQRGPGDCWDIYAEEAIRIADDFSDCTDDLRWYEAHKWAGCSLVYAVRSEGAMAWFIACNGGVPFSG